MSVIKTAVIAVTVVLILTGVMIPLLPTDETSVGWTYDDYRPCDADDTATGSLERVDVGGKAYIHAQAVGTGTIVHGGTVTEHKVGKARLDLVFIYGQSNAAYRNAVPDEADPKPVIGTGYYFGFSDRYAALASENSTGMSYQDATFWTMYDDTGALRIGDKAPALTYEYNRLTGHKVYIVDGAIGGRPIADFLPESSYVWAYGKNVLTRALDLVDPDLFDLHVGPYVWVQGEANGGTAVSNYYYSFLTMHRAIQDGKLGVPLKTAYLSLMPAKYPSSREAQELLAEKNPSIVIATDLANTFTVDNGLMGSDNTHYTQAGNNLIGAALGKAIAEGSGYAKHPIESGYTGLLGTVPVIILAGLLMALAVGIVRRRDI